jgi:hypothetical protein
MKYEFTLIISTQKCEQNIIHYSTITIVQVDVNVNIDFVYIFAFQKYDHSLNCGI